MWPPKYMLPLCGDRLFARRRERNLGSENRFEEPWQLEALDESVL